VGSLVTKRELPSAYWRPTDTILKVVVPSSMHKSLDSLLVASLFAFLRAHTAPPCDWPSCRCQKFVHMDNAHVAPSCGTGLVIVRNCIFSHFTSIVFLCGWQGEHVYQTWENPRQD
jgi:hypothetical protein